MNDARHEKLAKENNMEWWTLSDTAPQQEEQRIRVLLPEIKSLICLAQRLFEQGLHLDSFLNNGCRARFSFQRWCNADEPLQIKSVGFGNFWSTIPELWVSKDGTCYGKKTVSNYSKFLANYVRFKRSFLDYCRVLVDSGRIPAGFLDSFGFSCPAKTKNVVTIVDVETTTTPI